MALAWGLNGDCAARTYWEKKALRGPGRDYQGLFPHLSLKMLERRRGAPAGGRTDGVCMASSHIILSEGPTYKMWKIVNTQEGVRWLWWIEERKTGGGRGLFGVRFAH